MKWFCDIVMIPDSFDPSIRNDTADIGRSGMEGKICF